MAVLKDILYNTEISELSGSTDLEIKELNFDSRKVRQGDLFFAIKGTQVDGHSYIDQAIDNGAAAIICQKLPQVINKDVTFIKVKNSAHALGTVADTYYGSPSSKLKLVGVTGTNGKTTTVTLLYMLFKILGKNAGLISTIQNLINGEVIPSTHTTPDALAIQSLLKKMVDASCTHAFMEVSSHAIEQHRLAGLKFSGAVFTNITYDHLDYHKTFEDYITAKKKLFDELNEDAFTLTNIDDKHGSVMMQNTKARQYTYSLKAVADFRAKMLENTFAGLVLKIDDQEIFTKFIGEFNAYNLLCVYASALLLKAEKSQVMTAMSKLEFADGRFEYFVTKHNIKGIVDYAHTPDALENVLSTIQTIRTGNEKVITVIGCGGDRDREKRPKMAMIAAEGSDQVILTSDNPRSEDPENIIRDMEQGINPVQKKHVLSITDRKEAIKTACALADEGDIILLAGKGHEKYQEKLGEKLPFNDKEILMESLAIMDK